MGALAAIFPVAGMEPAALLVGAETMTEALTFNELWQQLAEAEDAYVDARDSEERLERLYGVGSRNKRMMRAALAADTAALRCADLRQAICAKPITCVSDLRVVARLAHENQDEFQIARSLTAAVLAFTA